MSEHIVTAASTVLVGLGVVLLTVYGASQLNASQGHRDGIDAFEAVREAQHIRLAAAEPVTSVSEGEVGPPHNARLQRISELPVQRATRLPDLEVATPDTSLWSDKRIADYEKIGRAELASEIPEGILRIPAVDLELPVFTGTQEVNLTRGAGIIEGTAPLGAVGNTGIAAHRDGYFRALKDVEIGDTITIETLAGAHDYRIDELLIVYPEDIYVLDPTDDSVITLVTCYPFYYAGSAPQRFIVRATKR